MIDFAGGDLGYFHDDPAKVQIVATTSVGRVLRSYTQFNPYVNGFRGTLDVEVPPGATADMRAYLKTGPVALTETWTFPWQAPPAAPSQANDQAAK